MRLNIPSQIHLGVLTNLLKKMTCEEVLPETVYADAVELPWNKTLVWDQRYPISIVGSAADSRSAERAHTVCGGKLDFLFATSDGNV